MGIIKVSLFQKSLSEGLNLSMYKRLAALKSDFLIFPEYFYADSSVRDYNTLLDKSQYALDWLLKLNDSYKGVIIGGSVLIKEDDTIYNATPIISEGAIVDWYRKRKLNEGERELVSPGKEPGIFILRGHRFAVLVNGDVLEPGHFKEIADAGIHLVFSVMNSPALEESMEEKHARDEELFCKPARDYNLYIAKCASTGSLMEQPLQGRSLVVTPSGISWRVSQNEEKTEILKTVMLNVNF